MPQTSTPTSNLAFFEHELENRDTLIHKPITRYTWSRDIQVRTLNLTDEYTSFLRSDFGANGSIKQGAIPWITQDTSAFPTVSLNMEKVMTPVRLAGREITYTQVELERAQRLKIALESMKLEALHETYQLGIDQVVYVGDPSVDTAAHKCRGLLNSDVVDKEDSQNKFSELTPDQIVEAINGLILKVWKNTGYSLMPDVILMPPLIYAQLYNTKYSDNADITLMTYIKKNCLGGTSVDFRPVHWCATAGADGGGRIVAYINDINRVRFNMAPIKGYDAYQDNAIRYVKPYIWALGEVEFVFPECAFYLDKVCDAPSTMSTMSTMSASKTMAKTAASRA